jgi:hypothetical protein
MSVKSKNKFCAECGERFQKNDAKAEVAVAKLGPVIAFVGRGDRDPHYLVHADSCVSDQWELA